MSRAFLAALPSHAHRAPPCRAAVPCHRAVPRRRATRTMRRKTALGLTCALPIYVDSSAHRPQRRVPGGAQRRRLRWRWRPQGTRHQVGRFKRYASFAGGPCQQCAPRRKARRESQERGGRRGETEPAPRFQGNPGALPPLPLSTHSHVRAYYSCTHARAPAPTCPCAQRKVNMRFICCSPASALPFLLLSWCRSPRPRSAAGCPPSSRPTRSCG